MQIDRFQANRYLAFAGFTACFLFVLAVIVLAFSCRRDLTLPNF